eukprot:gene16905-77_t
MSGAYSGFHPGFDEDDYSTLIKPVVDRHLYFAGEHVCDNLSGYTHGGLQTGLQAAQ